MKLRINGKEVECAGGTTYAALFRELGAMDGALGVHKNGATISLNAEAEGGADVGIITYKDEEGRRIYERTLQFVLLAAVKRVLPDARVRIEHSFGQGLYCYIHEGILTTQQVADIRAQMRAIIDADLPITRKDATKADAVNYFRETGQTDKLRLMKYRRYENFCFYKLGDMYEYFYGEMAPSTAAVAVCDLRLYFPGMVLMMPDKANPAQVAQFQDMPKIARTFAESNRWNAILGCSNAADLNEMVEKRRLREFIRVNEALHERAVAKIADEFVESGARVILIAGPSSSGKTTFAHRLQIALKVLGKRPGKVSLDDYFINREMVPVDENGMRDLERLDILDIKLLNEHLLQLLRGDTIQAPEFDFVTGTRRAQTHAMRVLEDEPIIIEGIHGLNDELTSLVPREMKFKIYVSALTTLNLDDHNRIRTTDARLLRRMVRDYLFRGTPPEETMERWESVRRGEEIYIFPYQEHADAMFNSSLTYELPIMKKYVYPLLRAVQPESACYTMARRLVKFLNYIRTADVEDEIPVNSILREFIGGCTFYREED
ncbi:MAG: nucleoside kinase [Christensenellales bacterium]|jgi:uridine kinase